MRILTGLLLLILATPAWAVTPDVTVTDKSAVVQTNKINCKASAVPTGGAVVVSVTFDVMKGNTRADGGAGTKIMGTDDWTMGNTIPLAAGTYKVTTTVTYTLPGVAGNQTKTQTSGNLVIP